MAFFIKADAPAARRPVIDDEARVLRPEEEPRSMSFYTKIARLPTYAEVGSGGALTKQHRNQHRHPQQEPMLILEAVHHISDEFFQVRMILFEIARRRRENRTGVWHRTIRLAGRAHAVDKAICSAIEGLNEHAKIGDAALGDKVTRDIVKDSGFRAVMKNANKSLSRLKKNFHRSVLNGLKQALLYDHLVQSLNYESLLNCTQVTYTSAIAICRKVRDAQAELEAFWRAELNREKFRQMALAYSDPVPYYDYNYDYQPGLPRLCM